MLTTSIALKSRRYLSSYYGIEKLLPDSGRQSYAFFENYFIYTLC